MGRYWLPTVGTFALVIFGYWLMGRFLSLLPWNRHEPISLDLIHRTFLSAPILPSLPATQSRFASVSGLCTIEAQVAKRERNAEQGAVPRDPPRRREGLDLDSITET